MKQKGRLFVNSNLLLKYLPVPWNLKYYLLGGLLTILYWSTPGFLLLSFSKDIRFNPYPFNFIIDSRHFAPVKGRLFVNSNLLNGWPSLRSV